MKIASRAAEKIETSVAMPEAWQTIHPQSKK